MILKYNFLAAYPLKLARGYAAVRTGHARFSKKNQLKFCIVRKKTELGSTFSAAPVFVKKNLRR